MTAEEERILKQYLVETGSLLERDAQDPEAWETVYKELRCGPPVASEVVYRMTLTAATAYDRLKRELMDHK